MPRITVVEIGSGANRPATRRVVDEFLDVVSGTLALSASAVQSDTFLAAQSTAEVTMDIEIVAALAAGASRCPFGRSMREYPSVRMAWLDAVCRM